MHLPSAAVDGAVAACFCCPGVVLDGGVEEVGTVVVGDVASPSPPLTVAASLLEPPLLEEGRPPIRGPPQQAPRGRTSWRPS